MDMPDWHSSESGESKLNITTLPCHQNTIDLLWLSEILAHDFSLIEH